MPTICPGCHRAIGQTPHCATCRAHTDPNQHCYCPECDADAYLADALADSDDRDPNEGSLISGCWCPDGHCTCDADAFHRNELADATVEARMMPLTQSEVAYVRALADAMPPVDPDDLPF